MFSRNNSPFSGLVPVILVLVLIGALASLALTGSDLTNFITNSEKARGLALKNDIDAQIAAIDLNNYKKIKDIEAQVQADKILADSEAYKAMIGQKPLLDAQKAAQENETARQVANMLSKAGALAMVIIGLGVAIFLTKLGHNTLINTQMNAKPSDPWQDPLWRKQQIIFARQREAIKRSRLIDATPIPVYIPTRKEAVYNQK